MRILEKQFRIQFRVFLDVNVNLSSPGSKVTVFMNLALNSNIRLSWLLYRVLWYTEDGHRRNGLRVLLYK